MNDNLKFFIRLCPFNGYIFQLSARFSTKNVRSFLSTNKFNILLNLSYFKLLKASTRRKQKWIPKSLQFSLYQIRLFEYYVSRVFTRFLRVFAVYKSSSSKKIHPLYIIAVIRRFFELPSVFLRCERRKPPQLPSLFQINY